MPEIAIVAGQRWRYRDEREDRNVIVQPEWDGIEDGFVPIRNENTGRVTRTRPAVLRKHYRLLPESEPSNG